MNDAFIILGLLIFGIGVSLRIRTIEKSVNERLDRGSKFERIANVTIYDPHSGAHKYSDKSERPVTAKDVDRFIWAIEHGENPDLLKPEGQGG